MNKFAKRLTVLLLAAAMLLSLAACAKEEKPREPEQPGQVETPEQKPEVKPEQKPEEDYNGKLVSEGKLAPDYAVGYTVEKFKGGYRMLTDTLSNVPILVVPEGMKVPEGLDKNTQVLKMPVTNTFIHGSNICAMAAAIGAAPQVTQAYLKPEKWNLEIYKQQTADGTTQYVGEDMELVAANGTQLAVLNGYDESTFHKLRSAGVVCVCEENTGEPSLYARLEWIKALGVLYGHEDEAFAYFDDQVAQIEEMRAAEPTGKLVAMGYKSTSSGKYGTRKSGDFQADYIRFAGGSYALEGVEPDNGGNMYITAEEFYQRFKDADVLIWSGTLDKQAGDSLEKLKEVYPPIVDFKAWQNGQIFYQSRDYIQDGAGNPAGIVRDIYTILHSDDPEVTTPHIIRMPEKPAQK